MRILKEFSLRKGFRSVVLVESGDLFGASFVRIDVVNEPSMRDGMSFSSED